MRQDRDIVTSSEVTRTSNIACADAVQKAADMTNALKTVAASGNMDLARYIYLLPLTVKMIGSTVNRATFRPHRLLGTEWIVSNAGNLAKEQVVHILCRNWRGIIEIWVKSCNIGP